MKRTYDAHEGGLYCYIFFVFSSFCGADDLSNEKRKSIYFLLYQDYDVKRKHGFRHKPGELKLIKMFYFLDLRYVIVLLVAS